jgi:hypothetical protein
MNWTWNVRSNDGAMNGLEFARCTTAGGFGRVLIHAAPADAKIEIIDGDDTAYLLSDQASFITGAVLPVDGGRAAQGPDPEQRDGPAVELAAADVHAAVELPGQQVGHRRLARRLHPGHQPDAHRASLPGPFCLGAVTFPRRSVPTVGA